MKKIFALFLLTSLFLGMYGCSPNNNQSQDTLVKILAQNEELRKEIDALKNNGDILTYTEAKTTNVNETVPNFAEYESNYILKNIFPEIFDEFNALNSDFEKSSNVTDKTDFPPLNMSVSRYKNSRVVEESTIGYEVRKNNELWKYSYRFWVHDDDNYRYHDYILEMSDVVAIYSAFRSTMAGPEPVTYYALKVNGELWGKGSNYKGILGEGTGIDRDDWVKIADDIAYIECGDQENSIYAIKNDKTLLKWGNEIYEPEKAKENVVKLWRVRNNLYYLNSIGRLFKINEDISILENVKDAILAQRFDNNEYDYILLSDNSLWRFSHGNYEEGEKILENVNRLFGFSSRCYAILGNGECWGWGEGYLGDGTVISRSDPVFIMNDVEFIPSFYEAEAREGRRGYEEDERPVFYKSDKTAVALISPEILKETKYFNLTADENK